jgi:hypothetical protein
MSLEGKGFYIWKVPNTESGNPQSIANLAVNSGFSHALIKIADGTGNYNITSAGVDLALSVTNALHDKGLQAWGWHYIYGDDPIGEANRAIARIKTLGVDGYVIDAESQFESASMATAATKFASTLRNAYPDLTIALSSFRFPTYHPSFPWVNFLTYCDINMPQVYWVEAHNPATQLARCVTEFKALSIYRPIIPTGIACYEGSWYPTASDITAFLNEAHVTLNLPAANFWVWDECRSQVPDLFTLIANYNWPAATVVKDFTENYIDALNTLNVANVMALYRPDAVHINSKRTIQGTTAIQNWYTELFGTTLPNAKFTLTGHTGTGTIRHITWTATSTNGSVSDGIDTIGLIDGKISYQYTSFSAPNA